ncbi:MAG: flavodoxin family protein [Sporomusaceae bacterium]|nr:flavodoxin family protein [Sporomusaceae bacterium]
MKKVIVVNGSPRKQGNTAMLLEKAISGVQSVGAEAELIHLYDLQFTGCKSCFACKRIGSKSYGKCAVRDDLQPLLNKIEQADALLLGSPIYFGTATGEMRSFLERLIFPYYVYDEVGTSLFPKKISVGFIYTMNVPESFIAEWGYNHYFSLTENMLAHVFGKAKSLYVTDTYQFSDYSQYVATRFNASEKAKRRHDVFPLDCEKAFQLGKHVVIGGDCLD